MNTKINVIYPVLLILLLCVNSVQAQTRIEHEEPKAIENALFGWASYISGHRAVVTAPQKDVGTLLSKGAAFFYELRDDEWIIESEVSPLELPAFSNFGISAAMTSEEAFIGALGDDGGHLFSGTVYVYQHNDSSWFKTQVLHPSDIEIGVRFGYSLDVEHEGDELVVGAYHADGVADKSGAAYIFQKQNGVWIETQKIYSESGESHDYFGHDVRFIDANMVAIGAYNATGAADRSGVVFIFEKNAEGVWEETTKLFDPEGNEADLFGYSFAPEINTEVAVPLKSSFTGGLLIGAPGKNKEENNAQSGAVYFYRNSGSEWVLDQKLYEEKTVHNDHFGVAIAHNSAIGLFISATHAGLTNSGKIFRYEYSESNTVLEPVDFLPNENTASSQYYGSKLMVNHEADFVVASPHKTMNGLENAGDVEFYSLLITSTEEPNTITEYRLEQNYPNPFNPSTQIKYQVLESGQVKLTIFNVLGQVVQTLVNEQKNTGAYTVNFNASALSSGFYFYRLEVNDFVSVKKMMLIK